MITLFKVQKTPVKPSHDKSENTVKDVQERKRISLLGLMASCCGMKSDKITPE